MHRSDSQDKRCIEQTHNENIRFYDDLSQARKECDKRITLCQICMKQETKELGKKFL